MARILSAAISRAGCYDQARCQQGVQTCRSAAKGGGPVAATHPLLQRSASGDGRRLRAAVRGSALAQKADQPHLQSIISLVPQPDLTSSEVVRAKRVMGAAKWKDRRAADIPVFVSA